MNGRATRGNGLLEPQLAWLRARQANHLVPESLREGRILDIGCGSYPYFLAHTYFHEKFAVDQLPADDAPRDIVWHTLDLNTAGGLPFDDGFFTVVTMLAVVEHLNPDCLVGLFRETRRVLAKGGVLILTTPASWSSGLLSAMANLRLVSKEEIEEHMYAYTPRLLDRYFRAAGFPKDGIQLGLFELGLNIWARAEK